MSLPLHIWLLVILLAAHIAAGATPVAAAATPQAKANRKLLRGPRPGTTPSSPSITQPASGIGQPTPGTRQALPGLGQPLPALARRLAAIRAGFRVRQNRPSQPASRPAAMGRVDAAHQLAANGQTWAQLMARRRQPSEWTVAWREETGTPRSIEVEETMRAPGSAARSAGGQPHLQALLVVAEHAGLFRLQRPGAELAHLQTLQDERGQSHVQFERRVDGIPVWGEDLIFHLSPTGELVGYNGHYSPSDVSVDSRASLPRQRAVAAVIEHLSGFLGTVEDLSPDARRLLNYVGPTADLRYLSTPDGLELTWLVEIRPNLRDRYRYFVDAGDGRILDWYNATVNDGPALSVAQDVMGVDRELNTYEVGGEFVLIDGSRPMFAALQPDLLNDPRGAILTLDAREQDLGATSRIFHFASDDNQWPDPVAVSAHHHAGEVFKYFLETHNRLGIDGRGGTMISIVHVTDDGLPMDNAYWNGAFMAFGDGDEVFEPLAGALDVAAHEMTHGVIERTVNLEYRGQSGALNESFADVFAAMVDRQDWQLGEDITRTAFYPTGALRDMSDPANGGSGPRDFFWQPGHMDDFVSLPDSIDNGGVHINSGIPNRACFLLTEAIGHDKTERIYYRILDARYLNIRSNFQDMRWAANRAAVDLYGGESMEVAAVADAFETVGIGSEGRYEAPAPVAREEGEEWMVVVNADGFDTSLFLVHADPDRADVIQVSETQVYIESGNAVDVAPDGSFILFVDADNNLRVVDSDGSDERILSDTGDWSSIALSPDGTTLAATSVFVDTTIFLLDLVEPANSREVKLRGSTTQEGIETDVVLFADAIDWDPAGQVLIYDAYNRVPTATGNGFHYWNVGLLNPTTGQTLPLFPPQSEGLHLGNPAFSQTTEQFVVFDFFDDSTQSNQIWIYDLVSGEAGGIVATSGFGFPSFSTDDSELAFEWSPDGFSLNVARVALSEDRLSPLGEPEDFLLEAQTAKWLLEPVGEPTAVHEEGSEAVPTALELSPNVPNPFNPETSIGFELARPGRVQLRVYDIRGALVTELVDETFGSGTYRVQWSGVDAFRRPVASGIYLYRLDWQGEDGTQQKLTRRMALVR